MRILIAVIILSLSFGVKANSYTPYHLSQLWSEADLVVRGVAINKDSTDDKALLSISIILKGKIVSDTILLDALEMLYISCVEPDTYKDGEEVIGFLKSKNDSIYSSIHFASGVKKASEYDLDFVELKIKELDSIQSLGKRDLEFNMVEWSISLIVGGKINFDGAQELCGDYKSKGRTYPYKLTEEQKSALRIKLFKQELSSSRAWVLFDLYKLIIKPKVDDELMVYLKGQLEYLWNGTEVTGIQESIMIQVVKYSNRSDLQWMLKDYHSEDTRTLDLYAKKMKAFIKAI